MIDFNHVLPFLGKNDNTSSVNSEINFEGKTQKEIRDFKRDIANSKKQELTDDAFVSSKKEVTPQQKLELLKQKVKEIDGEIDEIKIALEDCPPDSLVRDKLQKKLANLYEFGNKVIDEYEKLDSKCDAKNVKLRKTIRSVTKTIEETRSMMHDLDVGSDARNRLQAKLDNLYEFYFKLVDEAILS